MLPNLRTPAWKPPPVVVASAWPDNPAAAVEAWFHRVHQERMAGLPFLNPALPVEVIGFQRVEGDWLGALVTPWCLQLLLLPGGGALWQDISSGTRRRVRLPVGELEFIADAEGGELPPFQYCPLATTVTQFSDAESARRFAGEALEAVLMPPPQIAATPSESATQEGVDSRRRGLLGLGRRRSL